MYALKTVQDRFLSSHSAREALKREAEIWVALEQHPNVVRCFFLIELDGRPFLVLEWVDGERGRGTDLRSRWFTQQRFDEQPRSITQDHQQTAYDYADRGKTYLQLERYEDAIADWRAIASGAWTKRSRA